MIITNDKGVKVSGNVGGERRLMTIDPEAMKHIMLVLTGMYSDNRAAVVREYVANALDSHTVSGQTRPVEVFTPSVYEPNLVVVDYGVGLDKEGIYNVYSAYGVSTKNDSNEVIGGLGLGSKSGFTLSGQFVVTGTKDGIRTVALFSLDEEGAPTVEVLSEKKTDDPNGVKVSIAVDDVHKVGEAVNKLSPFWPKGKVLVDGRPTTSIYDELTKVSDGIYLADPSYGFTVDMGGVPYRINSTMLNDIHSTLSSDDVANYAIQRMNSYGVGIIAQLPIGSVSITPDRESLSNTPKTQKVLTEALRRVFADQEKEINNILHTSKNVFEVFEKLNDYSDLVGHDYLRSLKYRGRTLKSLFVEDDIKNISLAYYRGNQRADLGSGRIRIDAYGSKEYYERMLFITGVSGDETSKVMRLATRYLKANPRTHLFVVKGKKGRHEWFSWGDNKVIRTVTLDEFRAEARKLPTLSTRNEVRYDYYTVVNGNFDWKRDTGAYIGENADGKIYFEKSCGGRPYSYYTRIMKDGDIIVQLSGQKKQEPLEKRLGQTVENVETAWREYVVERKKNLTELDKLAIGFNPNMNYVGIRDSLKDAGYTHNILDTLVTDYENAKAHVDKMDKDEVNFLRNIAHDLAVDTDLVTRYDEWAGRYVLVEGVLTQQSRYRYRYDTTYFAHMAEYMKAIDSKEDN